MTSAGDDPIELEDTYHDADQMCCISVIEHEITYLKVMMKKMKQDDKDFFETKIESLEFAKDNLESSVGSGIMTPEKYIIGVKKYQA